MEREINILPKRKIVLFLSKTGLGELTQFYLRIFTFLVYFHANPHGKPSERNVVHISIIVLSHTTSHDF